MTRMRRKNPVRIDKITVRFRKIVKLPNKKDYLKKTVKSVEIFKERH